MIGITFLMLLSSLVRLNANQFCITHNEGKGMCVPITNCSTASREFRETRTSPIVCSWTEPQPIICCPIYYLDVNQTETHKLTTTSVPYPSIQGTNVHVQTTTGRDELISTRSVHDKSYPKLRKELHRCARRGYKGHIAGGYLVATAADCPWMVGLFTKLQVDDPSLDDEYSHFCGGTIISENVILTAAHCIDSSTGIKLSELFIGIGSNDIYETTKLPVEQIIIHPKYVAGKSYHDIALLVMATPITYTDTVRSICLPTPSMIHTLKNDENLLDDSSSGITDIEVTGWGRQSTGGRSSSELRSAELQIVPNEKCNKSYSRLTKSNMPEGIRGDQLCAGSPGGGKDACSGDSGGPLIVAAYQELDDGAVHSLYFQIGIVSYGYQCARKEYPGVFTRIISFIDWIEDQLTL